MSQQFKKIAKIQIVSNLCLDMNGKVLGGGVERWTWDLANIAKKISDNVEVYQRSDDDFKLKISNINFFGYKVKSGFLGNVFFTLKLNRILDKNAITIFISHELIMFSNVKYSIGVNHGVWWNGEFSLLKKMVNVLIQKYLLKKTNKIICVDTNYINWCNDNLKGKKRWRHKFEFVPNYADTNVFKYLKKYKKSVSDSIITYPRRLNFTKIEENPRGLGIYLEAIKLLEEQNYKFKYKFVGRGEELQNKLKLILDKCKIDESRYVIKDVGIDEMAYEYKSSDIVVIPTLAQEGTSLSAVEAISSGCSLVTTPIGGLGNLVFNNFNGIVSGLDAVSLSDSIIRAYENIEMLSENCSNIRKTFSKERWDKQITSVILNENRKISDLIENKIR